MPLEPGARLGPYELVGPLGSGGMGMVYEAIDPRLKRSVAIKVLPPELTRDERAKRRFQQEAQAASALDHPNICTIFETGELPDGRLYLVMACYKGETLQALLSRGALAPEQAAAIAMQIGDGLAVAHENGIVHRDIKPANVMVMPDQTVRILDFGLAKFAGTDGPTEAGVVLGTVAYMSPEQMRGDEVDAGTDIWSLGVLLYEMVSGSRPFPAATLPGLYRAIEYDFPPPLSNHTLQRVIDRALAKARAHRYASMRDMTADLRNELGTSSEVTRTGAVVPEVPSIAVLAFVNTSADPENEFFADGLSEEIINTLGQIKGLRVAARGSSFFFKGQHVDVRDVGRRLQVDAVLEGSVRKSGSHLRITAELVKTRDGYQLWSERYDRELKDIFAVQDEIASTIADRLKISLVSEPPAVPVARGTENVNAYEAYLKGRALLYKRGRHIHGAIKYFEEAIALDPDYALSWAGLADGCTALGHYGLSTSREPLARAKAAALKAVSLDSSLAETRCALAMTALVYDFDLPTAKREFGIALGINPGYPQAVAWYSLWVLSFVEGRFDEAVEVMRPVVAADPLFGYNHRVWAAELAFSGRHAEAIAESLTSIELEPESFMPYWTLLLSYGLAGQYPEAVAAGLAALSISGRHPFVMMMLAATYADCGRQAEARMLCDELQRRAETQWVPPALWASVAASAGLPDEAVRLMTRAVREGDPQILSMLFALPQAAGLREVLANAGVLEECRRAVRLSGPDVQAPAK